MLKDEFRFFKENHDKLLEEYPDKYLVIKDGKVLFAENSTEAAIKNAVDAGLELGTFLVQYCSEGDSAYTQTFHSNVIFA